jgi:hypothetical protein
MFETFVLQTELERPHINILHVINFLEQGLLQKVILLQLLNVAPFMEHTFIPTFTKAYYIDHTLSQFNPFHSHFLNINFILSYSSRLNIPCDLFH